MKNKTSSLIGLKVKELRLAKKLTLKEVSAGSGLSTGFLSQLERGLSTVAIDSLMKIATILDVPINVFFNNLPSDSDVDVVRSFEKAYQSVTPQMIQYPLSNNLESYHFLAREFTLLPLSEELDEQITYSHQGEEFIYVLEGVLTIYVNKQKVSLYPGDSISLQSENEHNWQNQTNKITRFIVVNTPNPFQNLPSN